MPDPLYDKPLPIDSYITNPEPIKTETKKARLAKSIKHKKDKMDNLAKRYNQGKLEWSLVDFESLEPLVEVLMYGKNKYNELDENGNIINSGKDNWKKGFYIDKLLDSTFRHLCEFSDGKDYDEESKLHIIGHIMCNLMFISYTLKHYPELDNREVNK